MSRLTIRLSLVFACLSFATAFAQTPIVVVPGQTGGELFGTSVAGGGDLDGDGVPDYLAAAPNADVGSLDTGVVRAYSGATGQLLHTVPGKAGWFAGAVAIVGDVDGDGRDDFAIGAPGKGGTGTPNEGRVEVYSGGTGARLLLVDGGIAQILLGFSVAAAGDVDADGFPDVIAGAPVAFTSSAPGRVIVIAGQTNQVVRTYTAAGTAIRFGQAVAGAGDVDADGFDDVIFGAPYDAPNGVRSGQAWVASSQSGATLFALQGAAAFFELGTSVAGGHDVTGDGVPDFVIGTPGESVVFLEMGAARMHSGATGQEVWKRTGGPHQERLGTAVAFVGRIDGDAIVDVAIGGPKDSQTKSVTGRTIIVRGADGVGIGAAFGSTLGELVGSAVAAAGDIDQDGDHDVLVGAPGASAAGFQSGQIAVYDGMDCRGRATHSQSPCATSFHTPVKLDLVGCIESNGKAQLLVSSPIGNPATAVVFAGLQTAQIPLRNGCELLVAPTLAFGVALTNGGGHVDAVLPAGLPSISVHMQAFLTKPLGGFAHSDRLTVALP